MEHLPRITGRVTNVKNHHSSLKQSSGRTEHQRPGSQGRHLGPEESAYAVGISAPGSLHLTHSPASIGQHSTVFSEEMASSGPGARKDAEGSPKPLFPRAAEHRERGRARSAFLPPSSISSSSSSGRSWSRPWRPTSWRMPAKASWLPLHGGPRRLHLPQRLKTGVSL